MAIHELRPDDMIYVITGESDTDRGLYAFLKGKALSYMTATSHKAEEWLYKAVKLNPRNADAWTVLGHCLWTKGQLAQARNCFLSSLEQAENAEALRQLSMIGMYDWFLYRLVFCNIFLS